jgi:hypothetical protein
MMIGDNENKIHIFLEISYKFLWLIDHFSYILPKTNVANLIHLLHMWL